MSYQMLHAGACRHPDKTAVIYHDTEISYAMLINAVDATIVVIERYQLPVDQRCAVVIQNLLDSWVVILALQALGLHTVCARSTAVIDALEITSITALLITDPDVAGHTFEQLETRAETVICIPAPTQREDISDTVPPFRSDAKFANHIVYTSGTTGTYKKVLWGGIAQQRRNTERAENHAYSGADTIYHASDFGLWTGAGYRAPLAVWQLGGCVILDQRPQWFERFLQPSVTHALLVPDKVHQLLDYLRSRNSTAPLGKFQLTVSGGFMSRTLAQEILHRVTRNLLCAYASTEINLIVMESTVGDLDDLQWLVPTSARAVEIVDDAGAPCPVDVAGHLCIVFSELDCAQYLDAPETNENVFKRGRFYPGDMAMRRADGRIRILGRSADVINMRGQKYAVTPFEQDIQQRLEVDAVCLFSGIGDAGEETLAIALEAAQWPDKALLDSVSREFVEFEQVQFALLQRFPRTQTGMSKMDRVALRKLVFPSETGALTS